MAADADFRQPADTLLARHEVPPEATAKLLLTEPERFNSLLRELPWATDIWAVRRYEIDDTSKASDLHQLLRDELPGIDWVTAGKLLAAKRPRLILILDVGCQVKGTTSGLVLP